MCEVHKTGDELEAVRERDEAAKKKREEDVKFMRNISNTLLIDSVEGSRKWKDIGEDDRHSLFNVNTLLDGENYNAPVILSRRRLASVGFKYDLTFYDSGSGADVYKIDSSRCHSLKELGDLVFEE